MAVAEAKAEKIRLSVKAHEDHKEQESQELAKVCDAHNAMQAQLDETLRQIRDEEAQHAEESTVAARHIDAVASHHQRAQDRRVHVANARTAASEAEAQLEAEVTREQQVERSLTSRVLEESKLLGMAEAHLAREEGEAQALSSRVASMQLEEARHETRCLSGEALQQQNMQAVIDDRKWFEGQLRQEVEQLLLAKRDFDVYMRKVESDSETRLTTCQMSWHLELSSMRMSHEERTRVHAQEMSDLERHSNLVTSAIDVCKQEAPELAAQFKNLTSETSEWRIRVAEDSDRLRLMLRETVECAGADADELRANVASEVAVAESNALKAKAEEWGLRQAVVLESLAAIAFNSKEQEIKIASLEQESAEKVSKLLVEVEEGAARLCEQSNARAALEEEASAARLSAANAGVQTLEAAHNQENVAASELLELKGQLETLQGMVKTQLDHARQERNEEHEQARSEILEQIRESQAEESHYHHETESTLQVLDYIQSDEAVAEVEKDKLEIQELHIEAAEVEAEQASEAQADLAAELGTERRLQEIEAYTLRDEKLLAAYVAEGHAALAEQVRLFKSFASEAEASAAEESELYGSLCKMKHMLSGEQKEYEISSSSLESTLADAKQHRQADHNAARQSTREMATNLKHIRADLHTLAVDHGYTPKLPAVPAKPAYDTHQQASALLYSVPVEQCSGIREDREAVNLALHRSAEKRAMQAGEAEFAANERLSNLEDELSEVRAEHEEVTEYWEEECARSYENLANDRLRQMTAHQEENDCLDSELLSEEQDAERAERTLVGCRNAWKREYSAMEASAHRSWADILEEVHESRTTLLGEIGAVEAGASQALAEADMAEQEEQKLTLLTIADIKRESDMSKVFVTDATGEAHVIDPHARGRSARSVRFWMSQGSKYESELNEVNAELEQEDDLYSAIVYESECMAEDDQLHYDRLHSELTTVANEMKDLQEKHARAVMAMNRMQVAFVLADDDEEGHDPDEVVAGDLADVELQLLDMTLSGASEADLSPIRYIP
eukprot:gnl/TRDRNA2_/TRDRNA2_175143_c5_seq2.p1 gnl/TRDRNA2_/TRDRNA2_175143_c5~~gnl/TRDRNA2_/TRDRNA2_175143_c5_seq2.p1  ORF type:complete len:1178 (-),score=316.14 gnl/TRDRNA2_/TRDRNA2_175143_c5_seq2:226-3300(-)